MSDGLLRGYAVGSGEGLPGLVRGLKASGASTNGSLTLIESTIDGGPPRHLHRHEDESFYVLAGRLAVECGGDRFEAADRAFVFLPRNVPHAFHSVDGPARVLIIATPGGLDEYFAALRAAGDAGGGREEIARIQAAFGIVRS
jgi:mannose-6-phosphate isomerase-like protein (cupin superfamily)